MKIISKILQFETRGHTDIINLTSSIEGALKETGLEEGQASIFAVGSTTGITTIEYEPGLVNKDLNDMYACFAPYEKNYEHNKTWGDDNGAAHLRSSLTGTCCTVPFINAKFTLGTWQQIVFLDFDTRPRTRKVIVQFLGK